MSETMETATAPVEEGKISMSSSASDATAVPAQKSLAKMRVDDVAEVLKSLGLGGHSAAWIHAHVDGAALMEMTDDILAIAGIERDTDRQKLLAWIRNAKEAEQASSDSKRAATTADTAASPTKSLHLNHVPSAVLIEVTEFLRLGEIASLAQADSSLRKLTTLKLDGEFSPALASRKVLPFSDAVARLSHADLASLFGKMSHLRLAHIPAPMDNKAPVPQDFVKRVLRSAATLTELKVAGDLTDLLLPEVFARCGRLEALTCTFPNKTSMPALGNTPLRSLRSLRVPMMRGQTSAKVASLVALCPNLVELAAEFSLDATACKLLPKLRSFTSIHGKGCALAPLASLPQLRSLSLDHDKLQLPTDATTFAELEELHLYGRFDDSSKLLNVHMPKLRVLRVREMTQPSEIAAYAAMAPNIVELQLSSIQVRLSKWLEALSQRDSATNAFPFPQLAVVKSPRRTPGIISMHVASHAQIEVLKRARPQVRVSAEL